MDHVAWGIEGETHDYIVSDFSRRLSQYDIEEVTKNPLLRERLLLETVRDLFSHYGRTWLGKYAPARSGATHHTEDEQTITTALKNLALRSKYLTFHLFDPLSHQRLGITSVQSSHSPAELEALYESIESIYLGLERHQPTLKTLVASIYDAYKSRPARQIAFVLGHRNLTCSWPLIEFPRDACEHVFAANSVLRSWTVNPRGTTKVVESLGSVIDTEAAHFSPVDFAIALGDILAVRPDGRDATSIALSLFLWEKSVGILPYYFRGASLTMPFFSRGEAQLAQRGRTFVAISCTAQPDGLSPTDLKTMDALLRGLSSAIAFCGIELTRRRLSHVFIPIALNHEIGNAMLIVSGRTAALDKYSKSLAFREALSDIVSEMGYIACTQTDIIKNADLTQPLITVDEDASESAWPEVFRVMVLRDNPPMDAVRLHVTTGRSSTDILFSQGNHKRALREASWPPAPRVSRYRLRQILSNLVKNALKYDASEINITISPTSGNTEYISIGVQDNGKEYNPEPTDDLARGYGHLLIDRIVGSLGGEARFDRPPKYSTGPSKTFTVVLPLQQQWRVE